MRPSFCASTRAIIFVFLCYAPNIFAQNSQDPKNQHSAIGPYEIAYCNANISNPLRTQLSYLQIILPLFRALLLHLLQDLNLGTASQHGYSSFFKTDSSLPTIRRIFEDIIDGSKTLVGPWDQVTKTFTSPPQWRRPVVACANPGEPDTYLGRQRCSKWPNEIMATVAKHSGVIYLCPVFFTLPRVAPKAACPWVNPVTKELAVNNEIMLTQTQYAVLIHEFVHEYNAGAPLIREVYGLQEVVGLNASSSLQNAQNFALYAAAVQAGCEYFPPPTALAHCRERCLGTSELNETQTGAGTMHNPSPDDTVL